jgi:2,3-bisphosphoglycerate-dependent phosphoglycerate mutase
MSLVLIRHGQSVWNAEQRFTGWVNVPLSSKGLDEAAAAGSQLQSIRFDVVYVSTLLRTHQTALRVLCAQGDARTPIFISDVTNDHARIAQEVMEEVLLVHQRWQLNERRYGALQGLHKPSAIKTFGEEQVRKWRRGYHDRPPEGESLADTKARVLPIWEEEIAPLAKDQTVLICAHGNSLRALIQIIEDLDEKDVTSLEVATGVPSIYEWRQDRWQRK